MAMFGTDVWNLLERGAGREHARGRTPDGPGGPEAAASVSRFISLSPLPAGRAPARCSRARFLRARNSDARAAAASVGQERAAGAWSIRLLRARRQRRLPSRKRQKAQGKPRFREAFGPEGSPGWRGCSLLPALPLALPPPIQAQTCLPDKQRALGGASPQWPPPTTATAHSPQRGSERPSAPALVPSSPSCSPRPGGATDSPALSKLPV